MHKQYSSSSGRFIRLRGKAGLRLPRQPLYYSIASFSFIGVAAVVLQLLGAVNFTSRSAYADAINSTDFVTTWKTDAVSGSDASITIPTDGGSGYNYNVDWNNDGVFDQTGITGNVTHNFGAPGTYTIRISGAFPHLEFSSFPVSAANNAKKLIDVKQWGTGQWQSMYRSFAYTTNLHDFSATDTPDLSNVTNMGATFALSGFNGDINDWDTSHVTTMSAMFEGATAFNQPLDNWDTSSVVDMSNMLRRTTSFNQPLNSWDTSNVTEMYYMFYQATSFNQPLDNWDTSQVTIMYSMFEGAAAFNGSVNGWDTGNVTDMDYMFADTAAFNQPLDNWDTSKVEFFYSMFYNATAFNQPLSSWDISSASDISTMFEGATSFNQPLNSWNTSNVVDMNSIFSGATAFNRYIGDWDTSNASDMTGMFEGATSFNQPLNSWNTTSVTKMARMFSGATSFNQPLNQWNTDSLSMVVAMFEGATAFNQPLGNFNLSQARYAWSMLDGTAISRQNYDETLGDWAAQSGYSVELGAAGLEYCLADAERDTLVKEYGWTITGDTYNCKDSPLSSEDDFVATWKTDGSGDPDDASLTIYTDTTYVYNYSVDWDNDGVFDESNLSGDVTHTYDTPGTYTVRIRGKFPKFWLGYNPNPEKLIDVQQWGTQRWRSMERSFAYTTNLHSFSATDKPDLSRVSNMMGMFQASGFNGALESWDVSHVTNMEVMFADTTAFNQPLNGWDTSNVTTMDCMFCAAAAFNQPLNDWDTSNVADMWGMFLDASSFNHSLGDWDIKNVTDMESMLDNSKLSLANYDATLQGWATQSSQSGINLGAVDLKYCLAEHSRQSLINNFSWNINGDSKDCAALPKETTVKVNGITMSPESLLTIASRPTFSGTSLPGAQIQVTIHSDPVVCNATAAADGTWSCQLPTSLPRGQHTVMVTVTYPDSSTAQLGPYSVRVGTSITNETPFAPDTGILRLDRVEMYLYGAVTIMAIWAIVRRLSRRYTK